MKKNYNEPVIELITFDTVDVLTSSSNWDDNPIETEETGSIV